MSDDRRDGDGQTFELVTLFGDAVLGFLDAGLMGRAVAQGHIAVHCTDPRDFTTDRHRTVDDTPFGGGPGMVMKAGPVVAAIEHFESQRGPAHKILVTPSAPRFDQAAARRLARLPRVAILCGRYEGIDDRVREGFVDECLSLGDFVLNGGEVAALAIIEAVARLRPGVIGNPDSAALESFSSPHLEHPQYTRPESFRGAAVPAVLTGGDHGAVERWRRQISALRTLRLRPDLMDGDAPSSTGLPARHPVYVLVDAETLEGATEPGEQRVTGETAAHRVGASLREASVGLLIALAEGREPPPRPPGQVRFVAPGAAGLRALRRHLRKVHGQAPAMVGLRRELPSRPAPVAANGGELAALLVASREPQQGQNSRSFDELPPIVVDLRVYRDAVEPSTGDTVADLALDRAPRSSPSLLEGLAIDTPMIDPSQPQSVDPSSTGPAETSPDAAPPVEPTVALVLSALGRPPGTAPRSAAQGSKAPSSRERLS